MDTAVDADITISIEDTSINNPEDTNTNSTSATLIDVIDLTKDSPRRSLQSRHRRTENASTSRHTTRSSRVHRRVAHREVLSPIILGRKQNIRGDLTMRTSMCYDVPSNNEIVTIDSVIENDKEETDKQDKDTEKDIDGQEVNKYYIQSDNNMPVSLTCPVCLEILSSNLNPTTTRCGHLFCAKCLKESIRTYKRCPTCKKAITLKTCIRLYL
ncbi:uncharacterized protein [Anoplolepis gracilipes]